jgi:peptidoglycan/LPS O-acetylase OafA/YrhL
MSPLQLESSPILAIAYGITIYITMLVIAFFLLKIPVVVENITNTQSRYGFLDGFRGILAIEVFTHHSFIAYKYFITSRWELTSSEVINQFGQSSVTLFFMITGFLFTLKSLSTKIDWKAFYISRLARLFPLYGIVVSTLFLTIFILFKGTFHEPLWNVMLKFVQWLSFFDSPNLKGFPVTRTLIAGVSWSLKYEVIFYILAFPLLHFASRIIKRRSLLLYSTVLLLGLLAIRFHKGGEGGDLLYATNFLGGITLAYAYKEPIILNFVQSKYFRLIAVFSVVGLGFFKTASSSQTILISIFLLIAVIGGLSIGGLLKTSAALWLGDISYGIYLIHGIVLWLTLFVFKYFKDLSSLNIFEYIILMIGIGLATVLLASFSYIMIEKPVVKIAKKWSKSRSVAASL